MPEQMKSALASHPEKTVIKVGSCAIGGEEPVFIAGPCSIESEAQLLGIARDVKEAGADILRGGAFKPRTSPYTFQGLGEEGIRLLLLVRRELGLPVITEIMGINQLDLFFEVDIIQVGARNMYNYELLRELGKTDKPILLKRNQSATLEELLLSAEHIMAAGNEQIILCERGIRSFGGHTRNLPDISAIPALKQLSHLPVILDPSHAAGEASLVSPIALAAVAAGADGLMIEVHNAPESALSDGGQQIRPEQFQALRSRALRVSAALS